MCPRSGFESPLTTTPVMTLIAGSAPISFHRRDGPVPTPENSSGRYGQMSSITGRSASSDAKKCRIAAYITATPIPAAIASPDHAGSPR